MIPLDIPGFGSFEIEHLILDMNGTLTVGGVVSPEVADAIEVLKDSVDVVVLTADTRGTATGIARELGVRVHVIPAGDEASAKAEFVASIDPRTAVVIGNGLNDVASLRFAAVGICVVGGEGAASTAAQAADVVVGGMVTALGLLVEPVRLVATLRS